MTGVRSSGAQAHSSGPASPVVASRSQALEVVVPALGVHRGLLLGEALVDEGHQGAAVGRLDGDGDRRGVRREVVVALPAPAEHDPPAGLDLAEGAGRDVARA